MAAEYLLKNLDRNRRPKKSAIATYVEDIRCRRWRLTHECVAFDERDRLIDGQNRLAAIIEAKVPVEMYVARDVPCAAFDAINTGAKRDGKDVAVWQGYLDRPRERAAIVRRIEIGPTGRGAISNTRYTAAMKKYDDGIKFIFTQFPKTVRRLTYSPMLAALVKAYYDETVTQKSLKRFCEILSTGQYDSWEKAAYLLREWLTREQTDFGGSGQIAVYMKTQQALKDFLARNIKITKIQTPVDELFFFPWEKRKAQ